MGAGNEVTHRTFTFVGILYSDQLCVGAIVMTDYFGASSISQYMFCIIVDTEPLFSCDAIVLGSSHAVGVGSEVAHHTFTFLGISYSMAISCL